MKRIRMLGAAVALALPLIGGPSILAVPAYAVTCQPGTSTPSDSYPGTVVVADNFESGTLDGFLVQTGGTGTASVSSAEAHTGACSAHLHATTDPGSRANFSTVLPSGTSQVYADGWFDITQAGVSGSDVPYFRFFSGSTRFVDVYRYNSNGQLWLRVLAPDGSPTYTRLIASSISMNAWHHVVIHVIPNGGATTVEVWFDGSSVYSSAQVNTVASSVTSVLNGAEHYQQMEDTYIDDLIIKTVSPAPPPGAPVASFTATPTSGTAPLNVAFTDTSTGSPTSWSWAFGDGGTSTAQNPAHTYTAAGTYTATLTATNGTGSSSTSSTITVSPVAAGAVPTYDHIVIVMEENESYQNVIGNSTAPYINSIANSIGVNLTNAYAEAHPSQPNYVALFSGSTQGVTDDSSSYWPFTGPNMYSQLAAAGKTFSGYSEGLISGVNWLAYHSPWLHWQPDAAHVWRPARAQKSQH